MSYRKLKPLIAAAALLAPTAAFAHPGHMEAVGFAAGLAHPVGGLDHVLAMVMVGVLASQLGGRAAWLVPATFVAVMAAAFGLGVAGIGVPFVEAGIALSVVALGAAVAFGLKAPVAAAMALVGLFAVFHGHAHGAEMPEGSGAAAYAAGFILATALLHAAGLGFGALIGRLERLGGSWLVRGAGAAASVAGVALLVGVG